jgi:hypothetical protein
MRAISAGRTLLSIGHYLQDLDVDILPQLFSVFNHFLRRQKDFRGLLWIDANFATGTVKIAKKPPLHPGSGGDDHLAKKL